MHIPENFPLLLIIALTCLSLTFLILLILLGRSREKLYQQLFKKKEELIRSEEKLSQLSAIKSSIDEKELAFSQLRDKKHEAERKISKLETLLEEKNKTFEDKKQLINLAQKELVHAFGELSNHALKENSESFLKLASTKMEKFQEQAKSELLLRQQGIDSLLKPIKTSLDKVDSTHNELQKNLAYTQANLDEQIKHLSSSHRLLQSETSNLVKALRRPTVRGRWGEMQLKRVVEIAGMLEHCDFIEQPHQSTEQGSFRPDMIIQLPGNKRIVIDSKTPLESYLNALEANDESERIKLLKNHAKRVRIHITQLSSKGYWKQFQPAPEYVILFLPGEPFFSTAIEQDPHLIEYGVSRNVILANPTTLIALLRSAAHGWEQELIAQNAQNISLLGKELYERISIFTKHFQEMGKHLSRTTESYNQTIGSLESRVLVTARRLKEMGISAKKELNPPEPIEKVPRLPQKTP